MIRQRLLRGVSATGVIAALSGGACASFTPEPVQVETPVESVKTDGFQGVIFSHAAMKTAGEEAWTPSRADVLRLEDRIEAYLRKAAPGSPSLSSSLPKYKRQYRGILQNGRRAIFANFFCQAWGLDWERSWIAFDDGGECYFTVLYDPDSSGFFDLRINDNG